MKREVNKTERLIQWLVEARSSRYCWDEIDREIVNEIIKRLKERVEVTNERKIL